MLELLDNNRRKEFKHPSPQREGVVHKVDYLLRIKPITSRLIRKDGRALHCNEKRNVIMVFEISSRIKI